MSRSVIIGIIVFVVVLFGIAFVANKQETPNSSLENNQRQPAANSTQDRTADKKATFAIFTNGTFRVFTAAMYHDRSQDVYIQANNPNIVHVKRSGITWDDFFNTLPFSVTNECLTTGTKETFCTNQNGSLKFYLNGVRADDLLNREIENGDRALISYGEESEELIQKQIDRVDTLTVQQ